MSAAPVRGLPGRVLLTGGSRGIGRAIAQALIAEGARLALVGRDPGTLRAVTGGDERHALLPADLARDPDLGQLADSAASALGGLDAFVSCAGIVEYVAAGEVPFESLARQLQVNFTAPFLIAQRAADWIARAGGGSMLFVSSTLATHPAPLTSAYAASKAALVAAARTFALELGPRGVRVNAIAPGVIDTDMVRVARGSTPDFVSNTVADQLEALRRLHPLGRLGKPEDVAETALYLLRAPYVTGAVVRVDGGLTLGRGQP